MFQQVDYIMVTVSDMKRSVEFYRDILGIPLKFESPDWTEFQTGPTTLALHGGGTPKARSEGKSENHAGTCSIGFSVSDLETTFHQLKSKGVVFVMPPTQREGEGIRLAVALDPDGMSLSFAQTIR